MPTDSYARYDLRPASDELLAKTGWYYVTFGPHAGQMVDFYGDAGVLTFPGGHVVLEPDIDAFYEAHPEYREDDD